MGESIWIPPDLRLACLPSALLQIPNSFRLLGYVGPIHTDPAPPDFHNTSTYSYHSQCRERVGAEDGVLEKEIQME